MKTEKELRAINGKAAVYALQKCKENPNRCTMGDFDIYHNDYIFAQGLSLDEMDRVCDFFAENATVYYAQITSLNAKRK